MDWPAVIRDRHVASFQYNGLQRVVVPVAFGLEIDTGNSVIRAFQVGGASSSDQLPVWRLFRLDRILEPLVEQEVALVDPPEYHRGDRQMSMIFAER